MLDLLEELPDDDPLTGLVRTDRVVMSGHSRGASTVWSVAGATFEEGAAAQLCPDCSDDQLALFDGGLHDPRVVVTVPLAGLIRRGDFGEMGHRSVAIRAWRGSSTAPSRSPRWPASPIATSRRAGAHQRVA